MYLIDPRTSQAWLTYQDLTPTNEPPTITQQPLSQTALAGQRVTFTVGASGTPPLSFQWRLNGQSLPGRTAATLVITNVQVENEGNYTVVVTNRGGLVISQPATLKVFSGIVRPAPGGQKQPAPAQPSSKASYPTRIPGRQLRS